MNEDIGKTSVAKLITFLCMYWGVFPPGGRVRAQRGILWELIGGLGVGGGLLHEGWAL